MDKRTRKLEQHDVAGVESERVDWSEFDDGYGNNISSGDRSMHRMMERGGREPWHTTTSGEESYGVAEPAKPLDMDPLIQPIGNVSFGGPVKGGTMHGGGPGAVGATVAPTTNPLVGHRQQREVKGRSARPSEETPPKLIGQKYRGGKRFGE